MKAFYTILLLIVSNIFMTFAWYGHLKLQEMKVISNWPLYAVGRVFLSGAGQPHRVRRERRPLLADAAQGYSGGHHADDFHPLHHRLFQGRGAALEPLRRLRLPGTGRLLRVLQVTKETWRIIISVPCLQKSDAFCSASHSFVEQKASLSFYAKISVMSIPLLRSVSFPPSCTSGSFL